MAAEIGNELTLAVILPEYQTRSDGVTMNAKRLFLMLIAFALLLPLSGCGCRKSSCDNRSFSPPPQPCCDKGLPPGVTPGF